MVGGGGSTISYVGTHETQYVVAMDLRSHFLEPFLYQEEVLKLSEAFPQCSRRRGLLLEIPKGPFWKQNCTPRTVRDSHRITRVLTIVVL